MPGRILIIDDDPDLLNVCTVGLVALGHQVRTAETGNEGLAESATRAPDVIVLDLGLPGMSGFDVAEALRRAGMTEAMKSLASAEGPQAKAAKQAEMLKHAYERAVANMQEMRDLIQQSNAEALALINQRFVEAMDEVKSLAEKQ